MTTGWDPSLGSYPLPPMNGMVVSPYMRGVHDLRWDDPALLGGNTAYTVVGVNIYRSDASDRGPFKRINEFPIGGTFFRDRTDNVLIEREPVTSWVFRGDAPNDRRYVFRTRHRIVKPALPTDALAEPVYANSPTDVTVYVDGVRVPVESVFGRTGEVRLINIPEWDVVTEKEVPARLPTSDDVAVEVSYYTNRNFVPSNALETHTWYRLTTVVLDSRTPSGYNETPLGYSEPLSLLQVERQDYIWREAIRRNQWILQQGGERAKLFVRKVNGMPCSCTREARTLEYSKMPENRCLTCYGTGLVGGYDGPYDVIIAPDDGERRIAQTMRGRQKQHVYEVWMGPSPLVTQRDFIVKQTNERYSVGPVRRPSNRGNLLQQHFQIGYIDEGDIRYRVPIDGTDSLVWPQSRSSDVQAPPRPVDGGAGGPDWLPDGEPYPVGPDAQTPMATEKSNIPDEREQRGRTKVWENQNY